MNPRWVRCGALLIAMLLLPARHASAESAETIDGARVVSFQRLASFPYEPPHDESKPRPEVPYPPDVLALQGQRVAVRGYLLPMEFDQTGVRSFFLMARPDQGCCFGTGIAMNEVIEVRWTGKPLFDMDGAAPAVVIGTFQLNPDIANGLIGALYRMDADTLQKAKE